MLVLLATVSNVSIPEAKHKRSKCASVSSVSSVDQKRSVNICVICGLFVPHHDECLLPRMNTDYHRFCKSLRPCRPPGRDSVREKNSLKSVLIHVDNKVNAIALNLDVFLHALRLCCWRLCRGLTPRRSSTSETSALLCHLSHLLTKRNP